MVHQNQKKGGGGSVRAPRVQRFALKAKGHVVGLVPSHPVFSGGALGQY